MKDCIFCEIVNKKAPAEIIYEDEKAVVFKNIHPVAPVHLLIVPKKHIPSIQHLTTADADIVWHLLLTAQNIAKKENIATAGEVGYKLVFNVGKGGGQIIKHLHLHLLGGWRTPQERDAPGMP